MLMGLCLLPLLHRDHWGFIRPQYEVPGNELKTDTLTLLSGLVPNVNRILTRLRIPFDHGAVYRLIRAIQTSAGSISLIKRLIKRTEETLQFDLDFRSRAVLITHRTPMFSITEATCETKYEQVGRFSAVNEQF